MRKIIYFLLPILFVLGSCLDKQELPTEVAEGEIHLPTTKPDNPIISVVMVNPPVADVLIHAVDGPTYVDTTNVKNVFVEVPYGGKYEVAVSHEDYYDFYMPIFPLKSNLSLVVTLLKETAPAGLLKITTQLPAFVTDMNSGNILMAAPGEIYVAPGDYHLLISRSGYTSVDTTVTVINNRRTVLDLNLDKQVDPIGSLTVKVKPELTKITVTDEDGKPQLIRRGSFDQVELPVGVKEVIVEAVGYQTQQQSTEIFEDEVTSLNIELIPIVGEVKYEVVFNSTPNLADLILNGMTIGRTNSSYQLKAGEYELRVQKSGYNPIDVTVDVSSDTTFTFELTPLNQPMGDLTLDIQPSDAQTVINGPNQFSTTLIGSVNGFMLLPGKYKANCSAHGYPDSTFDFQIVDGQNTEVNIELTKIPDEPINHQPKITKFDISPTTGVVPFKVVYEIIATDADGDTLNYAVDFGDGTVMTGKTGEHIYTVPGLYAATAVAVDDGDLDDKVSKSILATDSEQPATVMTVKSKPDVAEVYVDNVYKGITPLSFETEPGDHNLLIKKDGYDEIQQTVTVVAEQENVFKYILDEIPKTYIQATANTDSVAVFADRYNYLGMTFLDDPLTTEIEPGIHYMEGVKPGWVTDAQDWFANEYEITAIEFNLEEEDNNGGHDTLTTRLRGWIEVDVDDGIPNEITSDTKIEIRLPATPVKFEITGKAEGAVSGHLLILNRFGIIDEKNFNQNGVEAFYLNNYNFFGTSSQIIIIFTVYDKDGNAFTDCATLLTPRKRVLINWPGFAGEFPFAF